MGGSELRERFLALGSNGFPAYEEVNVEGFGAVKVKCLTAGERDRFEMEHIDHKKADFRARLAATCCIDDRGMRIFTDDDVTLLTELPAHVLDPIVQAAARINRLTEADQSDLRKN